MVAVRLYPPRTLRLRPSIIFLAISSPAHSFLHFRSLERRHKRLAIGFLLSLFIILLLARPSPPSPITGLPASQLFSPDLPAHLAARYTAPVVRSSDLTPLPPLYSRPGSYFNRGARFLFYTAGYGQFNNQIVSLVNALLIARRLDAVLVLPYVRLGKESKWDAERIGLHDEMRITRQLVGDYFNYSRLLTAEHVVQPTAFFHSPDGSEFLDWRNITVAYRSGGYFRSLVKYASKEILHRKRVRPQVLAPNHERVRLDNFCDMDPYSLLATVNEQGRNGRFVLLPVVFRRHNLNCSEQEPRWINVRRNLVPRTEFITAVDSLIRDLPRPILAVHLRFFLNGDSGNFTARSVVDMMFRDFGEHLANSSSLFISYSPSSVESLEVAQLLQKRFHGVVTDGQDFVKYFRAEHFMYSTLSLSAVLFDLWACVKSDLFLGRLGSSLSWNVVYWRQALRKEFGFDQWVVDNPLWYELANFSTRGVSRKEGPRGGVQLARD